MAKGIIGPQKRPQDFGMTTKDYHLVVNDISETCKAFRGDGTHLWTVDCLARGQGLEDVYWRKHTDTPPGVYLIGQVYRDYDNPNGTSMRDKLSYGWYSFDLIDLEGQERNNGRAGIMIHGGGTALGWPGAWAPHQRLLPTLGCIRMQNSDLQSLVLPLVDSKRQVFVSVFQEAYS